VVHRLEEIGDVVRLDDRLLLRSAGMIGVRRADERMLAPRITNMTRPSRTARRTIAAR
jgi:hypothetical protein